MSAHAPATFLAENERAGSIPTWVGVLGGGLAGVGALLFFSGPNGVNPYTVASFSMIPLGFMVILSGKFYYGSPATKRNMIRGTIATFSFLMIIAGVYMGILLAAGAF